MIKSFLILTVVFSGCAVFAKPSLVVTPESHDFGTVIRGVTVSHVYQIENRGTEPIEILLVKTSCGCSASVLRETLVQDDRVLGARLLDILPGPYSSHQGNAIDRGNTDPAGRHRR